MPKSTNLNITQNVVLSSAYWFNSTGVVAKPIYTAGANDAVIKTLVVSNNTAAAPTFGFAIQPPSPVTTTVAACSATGSSATFTTSNAGFSAIGVGMLVNGTGLVPNTFVSAIASNTSLTLSQAATATNNNASFTFTPWGLISQISVAASAGGAAAGNLPNVDILGSTYLYGLPYDGAGKNVLPLPANYQLWAAPLTIPTANSGAYTVTVIAEEY